MKFDKPPLTFKEQVDLLISRGLIVNNPSQAATQLKNINYYRLSAYRFPFCEIDDKILCSFLRQLTVVRNFCAHHARLWNRKFPTEFSYARNLQNYFNTSAPKKLYNTLVMLLHYVRILYGEII